MKPETRLNTRHKVRKTAGEKQQRTLIVIPGENQSRLVPVEEAEQGFSRDQLKKLVRDVDARHVHTREFDGKRLTYIEGWYAMAQANAIFGYAGWDREMVHFERVMERTKSDATIICGYMARVRIRVRAGSTEIVREGTGWGSASASTATAANERASNPPRPMPPSALYRPSAPVLASASMTKTMSWPTKGRPLLCLPLTGVPWPGISRQRATAPGCAN